MRLILAIAATAVAALTSPVFAQGDVTPEQAEAATAAIEEFELSDTLYQNLWCGAAFTLVESMLRDGGSTADADSVIPLKDAVFGKAATEAVTAGISEEDFVALSQQFNTLVVSQKEDSDFTQEECTAAAQ